MKSGSDSPCSREVGVNSVSCPDVCAGPTSPRHRLPTAGHRRIDKAAQRAQALPSPPPVAQAPPSGSPPATSGGRRRATPRPCSVASPSPSPAASSSASLGPLRTVWAAWLAGGGLNAAGVGVVPAWRLALVAVGAIRCRRACWPSESNQVKKVIFLTCILTRTARL